MTNDLDIWGHMNCDADCLAKKFFEQIDTNKVKLIEEGFFIWQMAVSVTVDCKWITSHVLHKIYLHIQGQKHDNISKISTAGMAMSGKALIGEH
jgi:hypothetical protein